MDPIQIRDKNGKITGLRVTVGGQEYLQPPPPEPVVDHAAEVEAALAAAKSARTVVSTLALIERLAARVVELEARIAKRI